LSNEALDQDLEQMSGSPALGRELRSSLRRLADGAAGPKLAEMARDLLDGRLDLRTVARSNAYADDLIGAIDRFQRFQQELTPEERNQFLSEARRRILDNQDG
jgi:hypothetical protein